jgi:hypothetical protein
MWRRKAGTGEGTVAGLALTLVALLAAAGPSTAQDQPAESFQLPYNYQPLALAYLAAPYTGNPAGRSADFSFGKYAPGESIIARFLPRAGQLQAWEGIPLGLYKRTSSPGPSTRLGVTGSVLAIGSGKPLDLRLYAFLPAEQSTPSVRLLTYDSDAWKRRQDVFSVLSDTTFVLTGPMGPGTGAPDGQGVSNAPGTKPGYGPGPGQGTPDTGATDSIACVNKRSPPPDGRSLSCAEGTGEVIEDPLTGEPALLMLPRRGPPQWLASVPTEICIEHGKKPPIVAVPYINTHIQLAFTERKGLHLCTRASWRVDYLLVRKNGIEVDGVKHHRLGSRGGTGSGWKLLAEAPSQSGNGWTQRIVVVSPAPPPVASAPKPPPLPAPVPAPVTVPAPEASPPTFAVLLGEWRSIRKLWYAPLPAGGAGGRPFKCEHGALALGTEVWAKDKLIEADAVSMKMVFKLPPALRAEVTQPPARRASLRQGLMLLAEGSDGNLYCGIATLRPGGAELEAKLQPEEKAAPPPMRSVELIFQREGPAALSLEKVSQGKVTKLADLDTASLTKTIEWSAGDKLRLRPVDPDFQGVSAVKVDGTSYAVSDDRNVEIPLAPSMRTIAIKTGLRPFTVPLVVATPHGAVEIGVGGGKVTLAKDAQARKVVLRGVRLGEEVTVEPKDADRFMVAKLTLRGGGSPRTVEGSTFKFERGDMVGRKVDLHLDIELKSNALVLPAELWLKPVVHLGRRPLALASCKVTLVGLPADEFRHERDGRTRVKVGADKRGRQGASYRIEVGGSAKVCAGFEGEALQAQKLAGLAPGTELAVPVRHPGGRAFIGVLSWPLGAPDDEGNWHAALKALVETFDAGAGEGRYLWGAIYAPDGKRLVASETADYTPLEVNAFSPETIGRFKGGRAALSYEEAVKRVIADVADLEGNVDLLVVAADAKGACKWSNPFASAATKGGRSALVRVVKAAPGQATDAASRARMCDVAGDQSAVGMAVEIAVDPATAGGASDRLLREALEAAAKSLLAHAPEAAPKAKAEPPSDRKIAPVPPAPVGTPVVEPYQQRYELPDGYRPLAVAYLAAPYAGSFTGAASMFQIGSESPGSSLAALFLNRADGAEPWEGITLGLFKGKTAQMSTRLSIADSALGLGGSKALHPTLYVFASDERPIVGFKEMLVLESDAGRNAGKDFSVLSDASFVLRAYLDAPNIGIESIACLNKRSAAPPCEDGTGQLIEDPLSGGPALLMVASSGPAKGLAAPKWLTEVPTEICVDGAPKTPPKVAVPAGSGKHREVKLARQGQRLCTAVTKLDYVAVREAGIRIDGGPPRKRLDGRHGKTAGAWTLRASAPRKGPGGDWVQQLVLAPSGAAPK